MPCHAVTRRSIPHGAVSHRHNTAPALHVCGIPCFVRESVVAVGACVGYHSTFRWLRRLVWFHSLAHSPVGWLAGHHLSVVLQVRTDGCLQSRLCVTIPRYFLVNHSHAISHYRGTDASLRVHGLMMYFASWIDGWMGGRTGQTAPFPIPVLGSDQITLTGRTGQLPVKEEKEARNGRGRRKDVRGRAEEGGGGCDVTGVPGVTWHD